MGITPCAHHPDRIIPFSPLPAGVDVWQGPGQLLTPSLSLLQYTMFMCCAILITIVQYCNFCQLSSWMRSLLATVVGAVLLILLYVSLCPAR